MTKPETAPTGGQDEGPAAQPPRHNQLRRNVDGACLLLEKNSKTLAKHIKTLAKHGTSLRWIKRAQTDHTARLHHIEDRLDSADRRLAGMDRRFEGANPRFHQIQAQLDQVIGLLGNRG